VYAPPWVRTVPQVLVARQRWLRLGMRLLRLTLSKLEVQSVTAGPLRPRS